MDNKTKESLRIILTAIDIILCFHFMEYGIPSNMCCLICIVIFAIIVKNPVFKYRLGILEEIQVEFEKRDR